MTTIASDKRARFQKESSSIKDGKKKCARTLTNDFYLVPWQWYEAVGRARKDSRRVHVCEGPIDLSKSVASAREMRTALRGDPAAGIRIEGDFPNIVALNKFERIHPFASQPIYFSLPLTFRLALPRTRSDTPMLRPLVMLRRGDEEKTERNKMNHICGWLDKERIYIVAS